MKDSYKYINIHKSFFPIKPFLSSNILLDITTIFILTQWTWFVFVFEFAALWRRKKETISKSVKENKEIYQIEPYGSDLL